MAAVFRPLSRAGNAVKHRRLKRPSTRLATPFPAMLFRRCLPGEAVASEAHLTGNKVFYRLIVGNGNQPVPAFGRDEVPLFETLNQGILNHTAKRVPYIITRPIIRNNQSPVGSWTAFIQKLFPVGILGDMSNSYSGRHCYICYRQFFYINLKGKNSGFSALEIQYRIATLVPPIFDHNHSAFAFFRNKSRSSIHALGHGFLYHRINHFLIYLLPISSLSIGFFSMYHLPGLIWPQEFSNPTFVRLLDCFYPRSAFIKQFPIIVNICGMGDTHLRQSSGQVKRLHLNLKRPEHTVGSAPCKQ